MDWALHLFGGNCCPIAECRESCFMFGFLPVYGFIFFFVFGFIYHKFKEKRKMKRKEYSHNTYLKLKKIKKCCKWGSRLNLQIHHKKLLSNGGTNKFSNLEKICEYCHKKIHKSNT